MTNSATPTSNVEPLAERVEERTVGPCRVLMLKTPIRSVVSWRGSFVAHPDFAGGDELVQILTAMLLDKGTRLRDRFAIAELLEDRGAQLSFSSEGLRIGVQGKALRDDLPVVLRVMAEQLRQPLLDADEFDKVREQYRATLQRALENTRSQANAALSRRLYSSAHPNYTAPTRETLARLDDLSAEHVRAYHSRHVGADELLLVLVGDVDFDAVESALSDAFGDWPRHEAPAAYVESATPQPPGRIAVDMPGKMNLDVRMGHPLPVRRQDADYLPLYVGNYILGGNFSARLMAKIRDEMGLTYGIHAILSGLSTDYQGHWQVGVTLSREHVEQGITATLEEVRRFVEEGPTAEELRDKKTTITGAFTVGLATTGGLASTLHLNATRGFDVGYLDRYPKDIHALTLDQVRAAIERHFKPEAFQVVLAGMLAPVEEEAG